MAISEKAKIESKTTLAIKSPTSALDSENGKHASASNAKTEEDALCDQFSALFCGYEDAHGEHELSEQPDENGKIKGRAQTMRSGATPREYRAHLNGGIKSLGVISLLRDNTCCFGAIDIDIQGEPHLKESVEDLEKRIRKLNLPLVVCLSKSGGVHLYLFSKTPISAKLMQAKLTAFAARLGYGGCEVFPKQVMRANQNDVGNWINIPYHGAFSAKGTRRYAIRNGKPIRDLKDFLAYCNMMRITSSDLEEVQAPLSNMFEDGPPCLQHLATVGIEGFRNNALMNVAIYYKKSRPADWEDALAEFNFNHVQPPLKQSELDQIRKSNSRKDYSYTCKNPPISNHCDKKTCVRRKFGIGMRGNGETAVFPIDNLTKCVSKDSVRWYAEHQGMRVELTTEMLLSPRSLQRAFVDKFNEVIMLPKSTEWLERLKDLIESCDIVEDPEDASEQGQFENRLDNFFSGSRPARNRDELIKGNSYIQNGRVYFRSDDLFQYLAIRRFQCKPHQIWLWLKQMGATSERMSVKGKDVRVWSLPEPTQYENTPIALRVEMLEMM
ncbi:hypothetical protein SBA5_30003 [Candidatus Sulfotelmatomonas gaucii]|uniref:TOTE conflict system primase domain-containing protein n=1 Tax=Candidatus Sulfuritelmatomonas gaucii TaxID=2043161 RepID=A0A2N9LC05_9BACT|nr:hypothetical protein SBA5_30003 [Candidatus Sulfotelmatomonas gaucii]